MSASYDDTDSDDENAPCRDVTTETEGVVSPDGGWGWAVAGATFVVMFLLEGLVCSFGLLLPELMTTFGASLSLTSIPPALCLSVSLLTGPASAFLVRRFGCRLVGFCGGVVASLGIICSSFAPNIELFILFFGAVGGLGVGLIYLPSVTITNMYFEKKRGVVAGIITSGSGFGLLSLAQLTEVLLGEYGWRGCYLVFGGLVLNFCVCACLLRPLPVKKSSARLQVKTAGAVCRASAHEEMSYDKIEDVEEGPCAHILVPGLIQCVEKGQGPSIVSVETAQDTGDAGVRKGESSVGGLWSSIKDLFLGHHPLEGSHAHLHDKEKYRKVGHAHCISRSTAHLSIFPSREHSSSVPFSVLGTWLELQAPPALSYHPVDKETTRSRWWRTVDLENRTSRTGTLYSLSRLGKAGASHFHSHTGIAPSHLRTAVMRGHSPNPCEELLRGEKEPDSFGHLHLLDEHFTTGQPNHDVGCHVLSTAEVPSNRHEDSATNRPNCLQKTDVLNLNLDGQSQLDVLPEPGGQTSPSGLTREVIGEVNHLPCHCGVQADSCLTEKRLSCDANDPGVTLLFESTSSSTSTSEDDGAFDIMREWFLRQRLLLLFLAGAFLIQLTGHIPLLYTPSYAYLYDVSQEQSALILAIFGITNTAGRLGAGLLVHWGCSSLRVHNLGTLLAGVACFVFPFCTSFPTIAAYLACYGFFLGAFPPLQPVILAEYLGIERLSSVFGAMCFVKAFANVAGAPLAGAVYTASGLYTIPVAGCGAVLVLAALLHETVVCCTSSHARTDHKHRVTS